MKIFTITSYLCVVNLCSFSQVLITTAQIIDDYQARVIQNNGSVCSNDLSAIKTFVDSSKSHLYWDKLIDIGLLAGNNLSASLVKLKYPPGGESKIVNNGFLSADYSSNQGLQLNPSKSLNTKTNLSTLNLQGLFGLSFLVKNPGSDWMGSSNGDTPYSILLGTTNSVIAYIGSPPDYVAVGGGITPSPDAFYHLIKQSLDSAKVFVDGNQVGETNTLLTSMALRNADVEAFKDTSSTSKGLFYCIDNGRLTNTELVQFYKDIRQLMYDLGRKIAPPFISYSGQYTTTQVVTIKETPTNSSAAGATIYYTTDGSTPTTASPVYKSPLTISSTTRIQAIAVKNDKQSLAADAWVAIVPEGFNTNKYYTAHVMVNLLTFTSNMDEWLNQMKTAGYNLIWAHLDDYTGNYITTLKSLLDAAQRVGGIAIMPGVSWWVDPNSVNQMFRDTWNQPALFRIGNKRVYTGWDYQPGNQHKIDSLLALQNITKDQYYLWVHSRYPYSYDGGSNWVGEHADNNGNLIWNGSSSAGQVMDLDHLYKTRPQLDGLIDFAVDQGSDNKNIIKTNKLITQSSVQRGKFSMAGVSAFYASVSYSDFGFIGAAEIWDSLLALPPRERPTAMSDITANDYAELSYISPMVVPPTQGLSYIPSLGSGFNLGDNIRYPVVDHSGIQKFLRPWVDAFKNNQPSPTFLDDRIFTWYWLHPVDQQTNPNLPSTFNGYASLNQPWWNTTVYATGNISVGNNNQVAGIKYFFRDQMNKISMAVHLTAPAQLKINNTLSEIKPAGAAYFEIDMGTFRGTPTFSIVRNGIEIKKGNGLQPITDNAFPGGWNFLSTEITSNIVTAVLAPLPGTPIYRINAGGGQTTTSRGVFAADAYFSPSPGDTYTNVTDIGGTTDDAIYQSERTGSTGSFGYAFPVSNGQYTVVLHFAEIYYKIAGVRIFDVSIEGVKVLDNYDIVKKAGSFTATTETFTTNVTDGILNIDFSSLAKDGGQERAKISAIEILSNSSNLPPVSNAGADQTISLPVSSTTLAGLGTDADGTISGYKWVQVSGPNTVIFSSDTTADPTVSNLIVGTYVFGLVVTDDELFPSAADTITITVNAPLITGTPVYRINAGGGQTTTSRGLFSSDAYYSPAPGDTYTNITDISGTTDDAIYQSERIGSTGTFGYAFQVTNGQYTVVLHFAEIYYKIAGVRIFDVSIEGNKVLDNYDIVKKVGSFTATMETFTTNVTDGVLNIDFSSLAKDGGQERAKISAIEILRNTTANQAVATNVTSEKSINPKIINQNTDATFQKFRVTVEPNPSANYFNLLITGSNKPALIKIYNSLGMLIETKINVMVGHALKLGSNYRPGVYYAIMTQGNEEVTLKLIKQH